MTKELSDEDGLMRKKRFGNVIAACLCGSALVMLLMAAGCGKANAHKKEPPVPKAMPSGNNAAIIPQTNAPSQIVRATRYVKNLDRFQPLPPRSQAGPPVLGSAEGKRHLAEAEAQKKAARQAAVDRIVGDPAVAKAWLERMREAVKGNSKAEVQLQNLEQVLLPNSDAMRTALAKRGIQGVSAMNAGQLQRAYVGSVGGDIKADLIKYIGDTKGADL